MAAVFQSNVFQSNVFQTGGVVSTRVFDPNVFQHNVFQTGSTTDTITVTQASALFTGKAVTIVNLAGIIPVGKGDILFSGQNIVISTTGEQPPILLPGGGGASVPPWRDLDRKKRRRYRALEEIEQRLEQRIEKLTAETQEQQQQVAQTTQITVDPDQYNDLLRRQAQVTQMLHEAQRRAEAVRQEKVELARLARIAFEAADEEEAIFALRSYL